MGRLSTHVLDTASGKPAPDIAITLSSVATDGAATVLSRHRTNADGRTDAPLLSAESMTAGRYRLSFAIGEHFRATGTATAEPPFLDVVHLDFGIADPAGHYHVPLLVSPWSYSTYRGS